MTKESYREYHRRKSREHYQAHKDEYKHRARIWGFEHPDLKVTDPVYQRKYREVNREEINRRESENNRESQKKAHSAHAVWTEEEYERLRQGIMDGKSYEQLGEELGRSVKAIEHANGQDWIPLTSLSPPETSR